MSGVARRAAGLAVAVAALAVVAGGSQWPWTAARDELALIRLDWRARGERVEECRPPTAEEIAERPPHMRPREICEGKVTPYHLRVAVDGAVIVDETIHGAGAREDRPVYVVREIPVRPGPHDLRIAFEKTESQGHVRREESPEEAQEHEEDEEDHDRPEIHAAGVTPSVALEGTFRLAPREVLVVTYDDERRSLVTSQAAAP